MSWRSYTGKNWSSSADRAAHERFFRRLALDPGAARQKLRQASVVVERLADIDVSPLHALLGSLGLRVNQEPADLAVAVTDTYLTSRRLDQVVRDHLRGGVPCLIVQPMGITALVGPLLRPDGLCWGCLKQAMKRHDPAPQALQKLKKTGAKVVPPPAYRPSTLLHCYAFVAQVVERYVLHETVSLLEQGLISFDSATFVQQTHALAPWVRCASCRAGQTPSFPQPPALRLGQSYETIEAATTALTLEDHLETLQRITSPYTGVFATHLVKQDPETDGPFYWAIFTHPFFNDDLPGHHACSTRPS